MALYILMYSFLYMCVCVYTYTHIQTYVGISQVAQTTKNMPTIWETQVQFLAQEEPLKKGMGTHSSILAWRILWTEDTGRLQSMKSQNSWTQLSA